MTGKRDVLDGLDRHTLGDWFWSTEYSNYPVLVRGKKRLLVMDFVRAGMDEAQPRFSDRNGEEVGGIMYKGSDLDLTTHPDAVLIARAPELADALRAARNRIAELEARLKEVEP
jgi:hypothetical protein